MNGQSDFIRNARDRYSKRDIHNITGGVAGDISQNKTKRDIGGEVECICSRGFRGKRCSGLIYLFYFKYFFQWNANPKAPRTPYGILEMIKKWVLFRDLCLLMTWNIWKKKSLDSFVKDEICYKAFELKFWSTSNIKLHKHIWSSLKRWDWKFVNLVVWKKCCVKGWTHFLCLCYYTFWFLLFNSSLLSGRENYANLIGS